MKLQEQPAPTRKGFTLIELLVVIAIIAVLVGMLLAGIMSIWFRGPETRARKEITQMETSIATFMRETKAKYLPSRLLIKEDGNYGSGIAAQDAALAKDSARFLTDVFSGIRLLDGHDWNGNGVIDSGYVILDGSQCLVFLLGGINGLKGFSSDLKHPTAIAGRQDFLGPFYRFEQPRLSDPNGSGFPRYIDPWESQPYAYFSNYGKATNGYNRYLGVYGNSDCANVSPYFSGVDAAGIPQYYRPDSFQIITAGKDLTFGPGGLWGPNAPISDATRDDMSNFHTSRLGAP